MRSLLVAALVITAVSGCGETGRRPGGPGSGVPVVRADARPADTGEPVEDRDGGEGRDGEGFGDADGFRDAEPPFQPDAATFADARVSNPDAFFFDAQPQPDATTPVFPDAATPRDVGVRDSGPGPGPDASLPPAQTVVTSVPGTSFATYNGTTVDVVMSFEFDNAGPGSESLGVNGADVTILFAPVTMPLSPASFVAPVGTSQRTFTGTLSSTLIDPSLLILLCAAGGGGTFPLPISVTFSNGQVALVTDVAITCL